MKALSSFENRHLFTTRRHATPLATQTWGTQI